MKWEILGKYVINANTREEARRIGEDMFGHMMEIISVKERTVPGGLLKPVNEPVEIGKEGKDLIRSVCEMGSGDMRTASCILSKLETWELATGKFPEIGKARLKALQIVVNALGRGKPDE